MSRTHAVYLNLVVYLFIILANLNFVVASIDGAYPVGRHPILLEAAEKGSEISLNDLNQSVMESATLQVSFYTNYFDHHKDSFANILKNLPSEFPEFKLNTIGRRLHSTILYLDDFNFFEFRELTKVLTQIDGETLRSEGLGESVKLFDPEDFELEIVGTKSKFLALKPHKDFRLWQSKIWSLIKNKAPNLYAKHLQHNNLGSQAVSENSIHISLIQWGGKANLILNKKEELELINKMKIFLRKQSHEEVVMFSPSKTPIEIVLPPRSILEPPIAIFGILFSSEALRFNRISRWFIKNGASREHLVEMDFNPLDSRLENQIKILPQKPLNEEKKVHQRQSDFENDISHENLLESWMKISKNLSQSLSPSFLESNNRRLYFANETHPYLDPKKAFDIFNKLELLKINDTERMVSGFTLYASSVRGDFHIPGDYDFTHNSLIFVPEFIQTYEDARRYAAEYFVSHVFLGLKKHIEKDEISLSELRIGSRVSMNLKVDDFIAGLEDNPYLTQEDFMRDYFIDENRKKWTLKDLVLLEDFAKAKIDVFTGERHEVSLQFTLGFQWRNNVFSMQKNALKGLIPFLRTGVYSSAKSYAISVVLKRPYELYKTQKGDVVSSSIYEVYERAFSLFDESVKESNKEKKIFWSVKLLKKFYNLFLFLKSNGLRLDEAILNETKLFQSKLKNNDFLFLDQDKLNQSILKAANNPIISKLNIMKRIANDFREYNEREQRFKKQQFEHRLAELEPVIDYFSEEKIDVYFHNENEKNKFKKGYLPFRTFFRENRGASLQKQIELYLSPESFSVLNSFEESIRLFEEAVITDPNSKYSLSEKELKYIEEVLEFIPLTFLSAKYSRLAINKKELEWTLLKMRMNTELINSVRDVLKSVNTVKSFSKKTINQINYDLSADALDGLINRFDLKPENEEKGSLLLCLGLFG